MPPKTVKGRTREGSEVLAVRIKKELYEDFIKVCERNGLDKASVIESLIIDWMIRNVDRKTLTLKPKEEVKQRPPSPPPSISTQSRSDLQVKYGINKCEWCGSTDIRLTKDGLVCNKCGAVLKAYWEMDDYYKGKYFQDR